jgi:hypothetical protein
MPGFVSKNKIAIMTATPIPAPMRILIRCLGSRCEPPGAETGIVTPDGPGWSVVGTNGVPHAVQNLVSVVFRFPHRGQIFDMNTPADAIFLSPHCYIKNPVHCAPLQFIDIPKK